MIRKIIAILLLASCLSSCFNKKTDNLTKEEFLEQVDMYSFSLHHYLTCEGTYTVNETTYKIGFEKDFYDSAKKEIILSMEYCTTLKDCDSSYNEMIFNLIVGIYQLKLDTVNYIENKYGNLIFSVSGRRDPMVNTVGFHIKHKSESENFEASWFHDLNLTSYFSESAQQKLIFSIHWD